MQQKEDNFTTTKTLMVKNGRRLQNFKESTNESLNTEYCVQVILEPSFKTCTYSLHEDKYASKSILESGFYQIEVTRMIKNVLHNQSVFVDLGADLGYFSLWAASLGYKSVAFDPLTSNAGRIKQAAKMSQLQGDSETSRVILMTFYGNSLSHALEFFFLC